MLTDIEQELVDIIRYGLHNDALLALSHPNFTPAVLQRVLEPTLVDRNELELLLVNHRKMTPELLAACYTARPKSFMLSSKYLSESMIKTVFAQLDTPLTLDFDTVIRVLANPVCPTLYLELFLDSYLPTIASESRRMRYLSVILANPQLSSTRFVEYANHQARHYLLANPRCPVAILNDEFTRLKLALPSADQHGALEQLLQNIELLVKNPCCPTDILTEIYTIKKCEYYKREILSNPNCSPTLLTKVFKQQLNTGNTARLTLLLENQGCPLPLLWAVITDTGVTFTTKNKISVVKNPRAPAKLLAVGALNTDQRVVAWSLLHPNTPIYMLTLGRV